ncbi:hypothetical protein GW765_01425 [Candidatus Parcubacteria bacterium]|nr:hypothetical protein [Candidatus Parcubacteria bacterium]
MKKFFATLIISVVITGMYSCEPRNKNLNNNFVEGAQASEEDAMSTIDRKKWIPKTKMDSIFVETVNEAENFIDLYGDTLIHDDFWWDSNLAKDIEFNRIRICPLRNMLTIEKRPFPCKPNVPVIRISLERNFNGSYFIEKSYFENNQEVVEQRMQIHIYTNEEMEKATAIFKSRIKEAHGYTDGFREKSLTYRLKQISE